MPHPIVYVATIGLAACAALYLYFSTNRYHCYESYQDHVNNDTSCTICLEEINRETEAGYLDCGHKFHSACVQNMLRHNYNNCPNCRIPFRLK